MSARSLFTSNDRTGQAGQGSGVFLSSVASKASTQRLRRHFVFLVLNAFSPDISRKN